MTVYRVPEARLGALAREGGSARTLGQARAVDLAPH
jgi:hypothetical protein